jgi:hypothetical protein
MDRSSQSSCGPQGHSADVKLFLHTPHRAIRLAQAGQHAVKPAEPVAVPAGAATLEVVVDGNSYTREVNVAIAGLPGEWAKIE